MGGCEGQIAPLFKTRSLGKGKQAYLTCGVEAVVSV